MEHLCPGYNHEHSQSSSMHVDHMFLLRFLPYSRSDIFLSLEHEVNSSIQKREYYSALKKEEVLPYATARMNLGNIMLSEISQPQDTFCMILLIGSI